MTNDGRATETSRPVNPFLIPGTVGWRARNGWGGSVSIRDDRWLARAPQAAVLALVILGHFALGLWLAQESPPEHAPGTRLEVFFIAAERPARGVPVPPFPAAPSRKGRAAPPPRMQATPSAPPDPRGSAAVAPAAIPATDAARLLDALRAGARHEARSVPRAHDFLQHRAETLPGRAEPFTPSAVVLHEGVTPEKLVAMIGSLFGGNYHPCPDTVSKIRDLSARNDRIGDAELIRLIDRERRNGCR